MKLNHTETEATKMRVDKTSFAGKKLSPIMTIIIALMILLPAIAKANTMIHNSTTLGSTKHGGSWGVAGGKYGEFTCGTCHARNTGNIKRVKKTLTAPNGVDQFPIEADPTPPAGGVTFLDAREGTSDFGDDSRADKTQSANICEACHTYDAAQSVGVQFHAYDMSGPGDPGHYNNADCMVCHPHNQGFKPLDCTACHGYPPSTNDNDGSTTTGLAHNPQTTGSTTAGAHVAHATTLSYACENCHDGYSMPEVSTVNSPFSDISINFSNFGSSTGTYTGQTGLSYNNTLGTGGLTCNTVYCHGSTLDGTDTTPTWTGTVACGDCHRGTNAQMDNAAALGSHQQHAGSNTAAGQLNLACSKCHGATAGASGHVSGVVEWSLDTADTKFGASAIYNGATASNSGALAPTALYGDCTNIYCHSPGQNATGGALAGVDYASPTWGGTVNCGDCHATTSLGSGSHNAHLAFTGSSIGCDECHTGVASDASSYPSAEHIDETIDVAGAAGITYSEGASHAPASGYGTCSTTYCHGDSTPTWGGAALNCDACHGASSAMPDSHGAHYNVATVAVSGDLTAANNATAAKYEFSCGVCHDGATHVGGVVGVDQAAEVLFNSTIVGGTASYTPGALAGNDNGFNYTGGTCGTTNCHDDGLGGGPNTVPTWGGAAMGCGDCHDALPATNAHAAHINDGTIMTNTTCDSCHTVTATNNTTLNDKRQHVDQTKDVDIVATFDSDADPANNFAANACNNIYCHSDGKTSPTYRSIDWGTTITDCVSCHDGAVAGTGLSGAHAAHFNGATLQTIGKALGCADCHSATASDNVTIGTPANHVNTTVEAADCSTNVCHSDGNFGADLVQYNPNFATDTLDCFDCHGDGVSKSHPTYANVGPADDSSNSHVAHVETSSISCEECHADTSTVGTSINGATPAQHVDGGIDVVFKQTGSYADGTDTCSTTYCHGSGTPVWGGAALDCDACHSASSALADSHGVHYNSGTVAANISTVNNSTSLKYIFECGTCHSGTTHAGGEANAGIQSAEVNLAGTGTYTPDGVLAGTDRGFNYTSGTCNTNDCHNDGTAAKGAPNVATPEWSVTTFPADCTGCHDNNAAASPNIMATNAHGAHINDGTIMNNVACNTCHAATVDGTDRAIIDKSIHVNGTRNVDIIAGLDGGNTYAANSCDAVYCHSDGKSTPNYVSVDWTTTITDCVSCHGGAGTTTTLSASHLAHIGTDATDTNKQFGYTCDDCHVQTATDNATIGTPGNHVNQARDVAVPVANGGDGTIGGDFAGGTCATTLCHGSTTPDWTAGATTTGNCSACHGMAADPNDGRDTNGDTVATDAQVGAHVAHLNPTITDAIGCDECHLTTVTNQAAATTYVDKVNAAGHIDSALPAELIWGGIADGGDDGQAGVTPTNDQAGCATTYCHDGAAIKNGWDGGTLSPTWTDTTFIQGTVDDCDNCHGYPPAGGHVADADCSKCHTGMNADDVTFTAGGLTAHLDGVVQASADDCTTCHAADVDGALAGVHASHTDVATFLSGKTVSAGGYGGADWYTTTWVNGAPMFGCGECHPAAEGSSHPINGLNVDIDPAGETPTAGSPKLKNAAQSTPTFVSQSSITCASVYCHSSGEATPAYQTTPDWYGGTISGNCNDCHGNTPSTGTHTNHLVGIHYETLYDGASALMASSGTAGSGAAHGDAATADTIGCQTCHNNTVTVEANDQNSLCATCHDGATAPLQGNMAIDTAGSTHINTVPDVVFADLSTFKSRAQIRDDMTTVTELNSNWTRTNGYKAATSFDQASNATAPGYAGGSCSNIECHNGIATPTWNTGFVANCSACHTDLP